MASKIFSYTEFLKEFPFKKRAREFWKLFKLRGTLENRHLNFNVCQDCANRLFKDDEKLKFETDHDSNFSSLLISFRLCEDCVERNIFETNSYIFKYSVKRKNVKNKHAVDKDDKEEQSTPLSPKKTHKRKINAVQISVPN